ncbi:MAG: Foldase protein PrsA precursor [Pedosphaera sp.]|nr:Foldase protein PrsA precursor [Pedosphaera sp.]
MIKRSLIVGTALLLHFSIQAGTTNTSAGDAASAGASANSTITNAAAIVDGHVIPMEDVALKCLRENRAFIVGQMIQVYVLDRECQKRGITVAAAEMDKYIAQWRTNLAPATLEDTLKKSHVTMAQARDDVRIEIEKPLLVADQIKLLPMVHCRELVVTFGSSRSESNALAMATDFRRQIAEGADFDAMVARHSEGGNKSGDMGLLYDHVLSSVDAPVLAAALALKQGEISPPIKASDGYHLIKADSTHDHHPPTEDALYADAARRHQGMFEIPQAIAALTDQSKITFAEDSDLVPGKPLPEAAAVVDGHLIPMKDVLDKCLAMYGTKLTHILVQNYVVDRECEKRGITVKESEIDERVEALRKQCAPMTLEEGMKIHHTTMAGLRYDFRQEIERTQLVIDQVKPPHMVHVRIILVKADAVSQSDVERADRDAKARITAIQEQLKAGKRFEDLAVQYCVSDDPSKSGDMGVVFPNNPDLDTDIVNAATTMKKGEISSTPIKTYNGYALLQAISDSDNHPGDEDAAYARALSGYRSLVAQRLVSQTIGGLIKKSNVVYFVHS